jgi:transposase-like protein
MKEVKANQMPETKGRRKFDAAFKGEAVALWVNSGKSARQVAADLGIEARHLYVWKKRHVPLGPNSPGGSERELMALRRENAYLRQQRDILKKTLGILSESPNNGMNGSTL